MPIPPIAEPLLDSRPADADVEVLVDGTWCFGVLSMWHRYDTHGWVGWVRWSQTGPMGLPETRNGWFLAAEIRQVET